jgi:hypothetical protein
VRPRNPARQAAEYRREGLRALATLLEEAGARVLETGKSERVAGGTLRVARRRASKMWDPASKTWRAVGETLRLVWTGPRMAAQATVRAVAAKAVTESAPDTVSRYNAHRSQP